MRITPNDLAAKKAAGEKIAMITVYDYPSAKIAERAGAPVLLVGDSLGMVVLGHETTIPVTLDDMIRHAAAVVRGRTSSLVVCDLPFLTYASEADAVTAARRVMQETGAEAVKLEGGAAIVPIVKRLVALGVPVMGHLGFTPQSQHTLGVKVQAKDDAGAQRLIEDALALEAAGAFAIVLELVPSALATAVSERLRIPTIGIGAGLGCDGQVQVWHDLLGLFDGKAPKHARRYAEIGTAIEAAVATYVAEVAASKNGCQKASLAPDLKPVQV